MRTRKHRACGSEFDYKGWKQWGVWRRAVIVRTEAGYARNANIDVNNPELNMRCSDTEDESEEVFTPSVVSPLFSDTSMEYQQSQHLNRSVWFKSKIPTATATVPSTPELPTKDCWHRCDYPSDCRWGKAYGVQTPTAPAFSFDDLTSLTSSTSDEQDVVEALDQEILSQMAEISQQDQLEHFKRGPATDFKDILTPEQQNVADTIDGVSPPSSPTTATTMISLSSGSLSSALQTSPFAASLAVSGNRTAFRDLAPLVKSAQRRKSRTEYTGSSPLANQHEESSEGPDAISMSNEENTQDTENTSREGNAGKENDGYSSSEDTKAHLTSGFRRRME